MHPRLPNKDPLGYEKAIYAQPGRRAKTVSLISLNYRYAGE
jgi:2',3'-cyclic-nucleotide 2'-phosphodiesterase (5'-nucleotidase family)